MPSKQPAVLEQTNFSKCSKRDTVYFTVIKSSNMAEAVTGFQKHHVNNGNAVPWRIRGLTSTRT